MHETASERSIDIILASEFNREGGTNWYSGKDKKAAIINYSGMQIDDVGQSEEGFRWIETNGIRVFSCYWTPRKTPTSLMLFIDFLSRLEASIREKPGKVIIGGDFNAKHADWGSAKNDAKGDALSEMIHAIGFVVCNIGRKPTCIL